MPAYILLRSRMVIGATLLALAPGCAVEYAPSDSALGASSGGGAAFIPTGRLPPAASTPILAPPREPAPSPVQAQASPTIAAASGGDIMELAVPPKHGTVAISGTGRAAASVRYTPTPGYLGDDQFSLRLAGGGQTVTVSIIAGSR